MGNNHYVMKSIQSGEPERLKAYVAWLLGAVGAGFVYWRGKQNSNVLDDPSMGGFNKANQRQMELMYGKMGTVAEDFVQWLKKPATQSAVIGVGSVLVAVGCFYFARLASYPIEPEVQKESG